MESLEPVKPEEIHIGCLNCSTAQRVAHMDTVICVGFGSAIVTCDGIMVYDGEAEYRDGKEPQTIRDMEVIAALQPERDWRVILYGPLHGETYQRQPITAELKCGPLSDNHISEDSKFAWVMVESNRGFA